RVVKVPRSISDEAAAALMLKGLTAHFLIRRTYKVSRGDTLLVHAAAGGVGLILCQWARSLGAKVIGVVGSDAKAELARKHGCRHVLISGRDELVASVKELTRGTGVAVVYDAVGKDTFVESLDCLRRLGMMVTFGNASGPPPAISPLELSKRGSLFLTRPTLFNYIATREELTAAARELFAAVRSPKVRLVIGQKYPLSSPADALRRPCRGTAALPRAAPARECLPLLELVSSARTSRPRRARCGRRDDRRRCGARARRRHEGGRRRPVGGRRARRARRVPSRSPLSGRGGRGCAAAARRRHARPARCVAPGTGARPAARARHPERAVCPARHRARLGRRGGRSAL